MKKLLVITTCLLLTACYSPEKKVNIVQDSPNDITVTPPDCPDYSQIYGTNWNNSPHANYGCANTNNIGVMATNPHDMLKGRGTATDAERSRIYVNGYNAGVPANLAGGGSGGTTTSDSSTAGTSGTGK